MESPIAKEQLLKKNTSALMDSNPIKAGAFKYSDKESDKLHIVEDLAKESDLVEAVRVSESGEQILQKTLPTALHT